MSRRLRLPADPRTVARDVSGIFEAAFPQLTPAIVSHFNRSYSRSLSDHRLVTADLLNQSGVQRAMLFELAVAVAEQRLADIRYVDWSVCLSCARERQQKYFDADVPAELQSSDKEIASLVADNLLAALQDIGKAQGASIVARPRIPGFRWIATGVGDFATQETIIEVKCSSKRFTTADYRQIVMYWLLHYIEALERGGDAWSSGILLNPRLGYLVEFTFDDLVPLIAFQGSTISVVETFAAMIDEGPINGIRYLDENVKGDRFIF